MPKKQYSKPTLVSLDDAAPVMGATCAYGADPAVIPYCPNGSTATGNCLSVGNVAGQTCYKTGNTPTWGGIDQYRNRTPR